MTERTKEEVYDTDIFPLMAQIIDICKANKIALLANFVLELENDDDNSDGLCVTTALLTDDHEPSAAQLKALDILKPKPAQWVALTITSRSENVTS